jgi:hypothetical protein
VLEAGPLVLWTNPALLASSSGWGLGAGVSEPFSVPLLARGDFAVSAGGAGWGFGAGASRFGSREFAATGWALGLARTLVPGGMTGGLALRRHVRDPYGAWAVDLGLALVPVPAVRLSAVARSALRVADLDTAPEPEWEIAASWSRGPARLSAALVRDAVGPISRSVAARLGVDWSWLQLTVQEISGGEPRFGLAVGLRLTSLSVAAAQETGPVLPESRAVVVGWQRSSPVNSPLRLVAPPLLAFPSSMAVGEADTDSLAIGEAAGADAERELDSDPELIEIEGEAALERLTRESTTELRRPRPRPPAIPKTSGLRLRGAYRWTAGSRTTAYRGLGLAGGGTLSLTGLREFELHLSTALSRDVGEADGIDEKRISLWIGRNKTGALLLGAFDIGFASALAAGEPGIGAGTTRQPLVRLQAAARATRPRVPAAVGAALMITAAPHVRAALWSGNTARDARPIAASLWPSGGRFHRSETELSRRGLLGEQMTGGAVEWSSAAGRTRVALMATHAHYRGRTPRLLSGGMTVESGFWFSGAARWERGGTRVQGEMAVGPRGKTALVYRLRTRTPGPSPALRGDLLLLRRAAGFDAATAWPTSTPENRIQLRADLRLWHPSARLTLLEEFDRRWSPPGKTVPARRRWWRTDGVGIRLSGVRNRLSLEWNRRQGWEHPPSLSSNTAAPAPRQGSWGLRAAWVWRPGRGTISVGLGHSLRSTGASRRERWDVFCAGKPPGSLNWQLTYGIRPGATQSGSSGVEIEGDPLGGLRFAPSTSPSRVRLSLTFPLGRRGGRETGGNARKNSSPFAIRTLALEGLWGVSSRGPRVEVWCTVIGGETAGRASALR